VPATSAPDRYVIRKASIELKSPDINATFAKVALLLNEGLGEYIEDSRRAGEGATASATITLRVAANRLAQVLGSLRGLGTVTNEALMGQDVTDQVVDLEARIRNEQRIEREMLELLDKRHEAPLKEVLDVRDQISKVRETIERYIAQRDRLSRLAQLATIAVIITPDNAPKPEAQKDGLGAYFLKRVEAAWNGGLRTLSNSIAWIVETVVAGLIWWIAIAIAAIAIRAAVRQHRLRAAREPAPEV
jgi:hypothetical protein